MKEKNKAAAVQDYFAEEWNKACHRLKNSGYDLNKIQIVPIEPTNKKK